LDNIQYLKSESDGILQRQQELTSTEKVLKDEFDNIAIGSNLKSKLSHIEKSNSELQQERTKIALKVGTEFSSKYVSEKAEKFEGFDSMQQSYPALVDLVECFSAIVKAELQLELYQTESDIESCVARIANMQQSIIANEKKIETLKENNTQLAQKITTEGEVKDSLLAKKAELQQKLQ
jgi:chromosome segregation ATPase